ncbi:MAG: 23S rRNA (adenine(2503)-C(2))-methyltransferase RlmN, partial [Oscillospiraceae bacterium]|nr:23S rRNA (adenine(2503)-C(2))-methyltransferase RlmN [Oscillospiraceae bacterium]
MMKNRDICSYNLAELQAVFAQHGEPAYRAKQLFSWLHQKRVRSFDEMTNLSAATRLWLSQEFDIVNASLVRRQISQKDGTEKYLFGFADGNCVETVAMLYEHGLSVCISTQVGCRMGCSFCASTKNGLVRSLTASEMLAQIYETERLYGRAVDSIVLMGIGEP